MTLWDGGDTILGMRLHTYPSLLLLVFASACSTTKLTYVVEVVNKTPLPLSVGLVKNGGQIAEGWTSPEQVAINAPHLMERKWGTLVPAGRSVVIGPQEGAFESGTDASLRIYSGDVLVSAAIAYGRSDPGRLDIRVMPGRSGFQINMDGRTGGLQAMPVEESRRESGGNVNASGGAGR